MDWTRDWSGWDLISDDPYLGVRRWSKDLDDKTTIIGTEYYAVEHFFEENALHLRESDGHRFGEGKRVASIPMHIWSRVIAPAQREGDMAWIKKWLNDFDNRPFRTFKGRV